MYGKPSVPAEKDRRFSGHFGTVFLDPKENFRIYPRQKSPASGKAASAGEIEGEPFLVAEIYRVFKGNRHSCLKRNPAAVETSLKTVLLNICRGDWPPQSLFVTQELHSVLVHRLMSARSPLRHRNFEGRFSTVPKVPFLPPPAKLYPPPPHLCESEMRAALYPGISVPDADIYKRKFLRILHKDFH